MPESLPGEQVVYTSEYLAQHVGEYLELEDEQVAELSKLSLDTWTLWFIGVLDDGETESCPYEEEWGRFVPPEVQARTGDLIAKQAVFEGNSVYSFNQGLLADKVRALYTGSDPDGYQAFVKFSDLGGSLLYSYESYLLDTGRSPQDVLGIKKQPATLVIKIPKADRPFAGFPSIEEMQAYLLDEPLRSVATFGPGLSGARFTLMLAGLSDRVHLVSGGIASHFVSNFTKLRNENSRRGLPEGFLPQDFYYTEGIADSIDKIRENQQGAPLDAAVLSRVHSAGPEECEAGVRGSYDLLRAGGYLLLNAPQESRQDEACLDIVLPQAKEVFGDPIVSGDIPFKRPAGFAIFQKQ
jgi:hypothetical protein